MSPFVTPTTPEEVDRLIAEAAAIFGREFTIEELSYLRFMQQMMREQKPEAAK